MRRRHKGPGEGVYTTRVLHRALIALLSLAIAVWAGSEPVRDVIIDQDGGVDDLIAISLLKQSPNVRVQAVTICPADSYLQTAALVTQRLLGKFRGYTAIALGHSEGINPFPEEWRKDAGRVLGIAALAEPAPKKYNPIVASDAAHFLAELLAGDHSYTILETGPLTNIADALKIDPSIEKNIQRIYVMGGAVRVRGNVQQANHDGSAEWNIFNQPEAAAFVIQSGIPITLVPLDATNKVPLTRAFLDRLAAQPAMASQIAAQSWRLVTAQMGNVQYYFWDTLTAAALLDPSVVRTEALKIRVVTAGASQGRTVEDPRGSPVDVALDASREKVEEMFLDLLGR